MKRLFNTLFLIPVLMITVSCDSSDKVNVDKKSVSDANDISGVIDSSSIIYSDEKMNELLDKSLNNGDCDSFNYAIVNSTFSGKRYSLFYETQVMAYKYNCSIAYYFLGTGMYPDGGSIKHKIDTVSNPDNFNGISTPTIWSEEDMTKSMALYYLLKAYELGEKEAYYFLTNDFGEDPRKFPKSSDFIRGKKK